MNRTIPTKTLISALVISVSGAIEAFAQCGTPCPAPGTLSSFINLGRVKTGYIESYAATASGEDYTIIGGGDDTWDRCDELAFAYHEFYGDFDIKVRVESLEYVARWSKAGIMARESLAEDARRVCQSVCPPGVTCANGETGANTMEFLWRTGLQDVSCENGGCHSVSIGAPRYPNQWIRLVRRGNVFTGYASYDGVTWPMSHSVDTSTWQGGPLPKRLFVGLIVSRHPNAGGFHTCRAVFRDYTESFATAGERFCLEAADSRGCPQKILLTFNRPVGDSAYNVNNYSLTGSTLLEDVEPGPSPNTVWLITESDGMQEGFNYEIHAMVEDANGNPIDPGCWTASFVHGQGYELRRIHVHRNQQQWAVLSGYYLHTAALALGMGGWAEGRPPHEANSLFEDPMPDGGPDNFGCSIVGILQPPADGNYRFACNSDDIGELYLSIDDQPANKRLIAREPAWNGPRQYALPDRRPGQTNQSGPIFLRADRRYFLQYVYEERGGGNNGSVTWDAGTGAPFVNGQTPIEEAYFVPSRYAWGYIFYNLGKCQILTGPDDQLNVPLGGTAVFKVTLDGTPPYSFTWYTNGVVAARNYSPTFEIPNIAAWHDEWRVRVCVANAGGEVCSVGEARLTVRFSPVVQRVTSKGNCHAFYVSWNTDVSLMSGTYSVVASNRLTGAVQALTETGRSYGANQREVVVSVAPDLEPDPVVYHLTIRDVTSTGGLVQEPNPTVVTFVHGAEYPEYRVQFRRYNHGDLGGGWQIDRLLTYPPFPHSPDAVANLPAFEIVNIGDGYGGQLRGWFVVPQTGTYRFWSASDDQSITYIATDGNPANKIEIAREPIWNSYRAFATCDRRTCVGGIPQETQSPPIPLTAGQVVYLEGIYSEGDGGDNYALTYTVDSPTPPANGTPSFLTASLFRPFRQGPGGEIFSRLCRVEILTGPDDQLDIPPGGTAVFAVTLDGTPPYSFTWYTNDVVVAGNNSPGFTIPGVRPSHHNWRVQVCVTNISGGVSSRVAQLTVAEDLVPPTLVSAAADTTLRRIRVSFSEAVTPETAGVPANYALSDGYSVGTVTVESLTTVLLHLAAGDPDLVDGTQYTLTVNGVSDFAGNTIAPDSTIQFMAPTFSRGYVKREIWRGPNSLGSVKAAAQARLSDLWGYHRLLEEDHHNLLENYGLRATGFLVPDMTGNHNFFVCSDDASEFWLSTDAAPANLRLLCREPQWNPARQYLIFDRRTAAAPENRSTTLFPGGIPLVAGQRYALESWMAEGCCGDNFSVAWQRPGQPEPPNGSLPISGPNLATLVDPAETANLKFEIWRDIPGTAVSALTSHPDYPNNPSDVWFGRNSSFNSREVQWAANNEDEANNYGMRISGWFVPVVSGEHIFYLRSDDASQLFLSPDANPANKVMIQEETGCCGPFSKLPSAPIWLEAGRRYYIEAILKEGTGGDFCQVAFKLAADPTHPDTLSPIPARYFAPFAPYAPEALPTITITQHPQPVCTFINCMATFRVEAVNSQGLPMTYQWRRNGVDIPGAVSPTYSTPPVSAADDGAVYDCIVAVLGRNVYSAPATLTVVVGCGPLSIQQQGINPADAVIITWDSSCGPGGTYCELYGATELVGNGPGTVWVRIQASDPDVISLAPGQAVMRPTMPYKFFRTASPPSCP